MTEDHKTLVPAEIVRHPVESANIAAIGYSPELFMLDVEFTNKRVYRYFAVTAELYRALMAAPSKGLFFSKHIKNEHEFTFMTATQPTTETK